MDAREILAYLKSGLHSLKIPEKELSSFKVFKDDEDQHEVEIVSADLKSSFRLLIDTLIAKIPKDKLFEIKMIDCAITKSKVEKVGRFFS